MTTRPRPNPNVNPASLSKSYDDPQESWKRLVIALWHPRFAGQDVITSLRVLHEAGY